MAGYDIGPRIGVKGEAEFNRQMQSINNSLKSLGSEMKTLTSEYKENENSQTALLAKSKLLQKQLEAQKSKMSLIEGQYDKQSAKLKELAAAYEKAKTESGETSKEAERAAQAYSRQENEVTKLKVAMNETQNYMNQLNHSISKNETMLGEIENGTRDAVTGMSKLKDAAKDTGEALESMDKGIKTGNLMEATETLAGAGEKIIDAGKKAAGAFMDLEGATTKVNTYFGLTGKEAEKMGTVVENIFRTGVTDSLEEVADGVIVVNNNIKNLNPGQLQALTDQAINLEQVFGSDMNESMRGVNALMTNFSMDAQTAMDYLVKGTQNGLDKTQELGDNISEYSGKFSQAGYSAEEYFQLLQNGLEGGAYNLDKVNDSINEVTTRLGDGTIEKNLTSFSQETQNLFWKWQDGGATQKDVINSIVRDIAGAENQQRELTLAATAFGTMGEDANLEVVKSLTTLGDEYKNVSGSAEQMSNDATTPMQKLQGAINDLQLAIAPVGEKLVNLAAEVLPQIGEAIAGFIDGFLNLPGPVQTFIGVLAGLIALFTTLAPLITAIVGIIGIAGSTVLIPIIGIIAGVAAAITVIIAIIKNWGTITEVVKNIIGTAFNFIKGVISTVVSVIGSIIKTGFNLIKTVITGVINTVKSVISAGFNFIKTVITTIVNAIKAVITTVWNAIKTVFQTVLNIIKTVVTTGFNGIKTVITTVINTVKTVITTVWNAIKTVITTVTNAVKGAAVRGFNAMKNGIKTAITAIPKIVKGIFDKVKGIITGLASKAIGWGKDFIGGLKKGIMAGVNGIVKAVKGIADKIKSFLHFSRPDEGPLREYEKWMPDMMDGLANGIYDNLYKVQNAARAAAHSIGVNVEGNVKTAIQSASVTRESTIVVEGDQIVLDGRVIGKTATRYITNTQKGNRKVKGK